MISRNPNVDFRAAQPEPAPSQQVPTESEARPLGVGDVVQEGDEWMSLTGKWKPAKYLGLEISRPNIEIYRRPLAAPLAEQTLKGGDEVCATTTHQQAIHSTVGAICAEVASNAAESSNPTCAADVFFICSKHGPSYEAVCSKCLEENAAANSILTNLVSAQFDPACAAAPIAEQAGASATKYSSDRILTRCPACGNDTLVINGGYLLCTWHECPDPTRIDQGKAASPTADEMLTALEELAALVEGRGSGAIHILKRGVNIRIETSLGISEGPTLRAAIADGMKTR